MNILMLSWRGPGHPHFGGAEINTLENVTAWTRAGHKVTWFTSAFLGSDEYEIVNGVRIIRRGSQNFAVHIAACRWYLFESHPKFDVVVDQFHGIPFFIPLYVRAPKLGFIHEVAREVWWLNPWPKPFNLIPGILGTSFEPVVFFLYRHVPFMTVSDSTKEDLMRLGIPGKNIHVFLSGVNLNFVPHISKKEKPPTVMFLGALSKDKGVEDAIEVFSLIHKKRASWKFLIVGVGDPKYLAILKHTCRQLRIGKYVTFIGFCQPEQKFDLLSRSHILINPSYREGWGLVNIEANAVGTPVVGYQVQGTKDSVRHEETGILVPPHRPDLMAEEVIKLIEDKRKYSRLSANSVKWSKQFSWAKYTRQSLALIEKTVKFPRSVGHHDQS